MDIAKRRKELNLTLEDVGKIVGVGKSTVRKWETGDIENMKRDKIALLAKALQVSPLDVMNLDENSKLNEQTSKEKEIKEFLKFEDYLKSLGYEVNVTPIKSRAKFLVEAKDTKGNVIGKSWLPTNETAEYTLIKNDIVSTFSQDEFTKLQQSNAQMLDAEIYKNSLKNYVPETLAAHRTDDPTSPIENSALENSIQRLKDQAFKKHGIKYK